MTRKVKGILLRMGQTVHDEKVLTVLTEQMGCISVFAKVSRKKMQYDQFYYGEWVLYETANGNYIRMVTVVRSGKFVQQVPRGQVTVDDERGRPFL